MAWNRELWRQSLVDGRGENFGVSCLVCEGKIAALALLSSQPNILDPIPYYYGDAGHVDCWTVLLSQ